MLSSRAGYGVCWRQVVSLSFAFCWLGAGEGRLPALTLRAAQTCMHTRRGALRRWLSRPQLPLGDEGCPFALPGTPCGWRGGLALTNHSVTALTIFHGLVISH